MPLLHQPCASRVVKRTHIDTYEFLISLSSTNVAPVERWGSVCNVWEYVCLLDSPSIGSEAGVDGTHIRNTYKEYIYIYIYMSS